ncbi:acyltransferase family protein [Trujillonella endophytica]|uniref:Peptidoglycan/LPS O-acetylase OafA/YrhL, contains acyltransferase and SGNH-hydrolase domains n=1 Tax=Trujillonella endophytica TaxID=673521 RepID=A0A1H8RUM6_9ACTN|nr:acyltransferase [Trujillella endophytica]SEO70062.1 Peptidoglycan/LPS O-acetylase OafA/YrhL, contains acyltransferase and SGNH-hydrolase domains [Trujillella endophytica]
MVLTDGLPATLVRHPAPAPVATVAEGAGAGVGATAGAVRGLPRVIPQLTGIRAVAALWVAMFHLRPYLLETFPSSWVLTPLFNVGHLGVDLFFVLSGFILTLTHLDRMVDGWGPRKVGGFLWLRLSRVWPVTVAMLIVYGLYRLIQTWITADGAYAASLDVRRFLMHVLLLQAWGTEHHDWNPIDWSISAEWMAYLAFGVVALGLARAAGVLRTRALVLLAVASLVPMVLVGLSMEDGSDLTWQGDQVASGIVPLRVLSEFFAGAFVALVVQRLARAGRRVPLLLSPGVILVAIVGTIYFLQRFDPVWRPRFGQEWNVNGHSLWGSTESVVVIPLFALLIGSLALSRGPVSRTLSTRLLVWGGKVSFAFYLVHWLFLDIMLFVIDQTAFADAPMSTWRQVLIAGVLVCSVAAGWALYRFVEEPMRKGMRRMLPPSIKV